MKRQLLFLFALTALAACSSSTPKPLPPNVKMKEVEPPPEKPSTITVVDTQATPDPFRATAENGDAPVPFVRDERSSRLEVPAPKTRGKELWRKALVIGDEPTIKPLFVLTTGNRAAVVSKDSWVVFDTKGVRIAGHEMESPYMRLDRASGQIISDDTRSADLPADAKLAAQKGLVVMVKGGAVNIGERALEGTFEAVDVAIDDQAQANVIVRQKDEVSLWTVPIAGNGAIGRHKIGKKVKTVGPPVLGKSLRVIVTDAGVTAYDLSGKEAWKRKGQPSGGVSITSDDHVLIADGGKVWSYDKKGKPLELWSGSDIVFATPPILTADGLLLVASGELLHALTF